MCERRRYWLRILLANLAGALAVVGVTGGFSPAVRLAELARMLAVCLKPIEPERLARALDKIERVAGQAHPDVRALAKLILSLSKDEPPPGDTRSS